MGNRRFLSPIELPDGYVVSGEEDLGAGGASVHVGDDPPPGVEDGSLWIDTDEATGDLVGVVATFAKMSGGSTDVSSSTGTTIANYTTVAGESSWCDPSGGGITVPEDGWYFIGGGYRFSQGGNGGRFLTNIFADGQDIPGVRLEFESGSGVSNDPAANVSGIAFLSAGQTVAIDCYHTTGVLQPTDSQGIWVVKIGGGPIVLDDRYSKKVHSARWITTTDQTFVNGTWATMIYDAVSEDTGGPWTMNLATGILTINETGRYRITGQLSWRSNQGGGNRVASILRNTTESIVGVAMPDDPGSFGNNLNFTSGPTTLQAGDTIQIDAYQNCGSDLNTNGPFPNGMWIEVVS